MIQLPKGKNLEGVLICSSNFIFCHNIANHPNGGVKLDILLIIVLININKLLD